MITEYKNLRWPLEKPENTRLILGVQNIRNLEDSDEIVNKFKIRLNEIDEIITVETGIYQSGIW